MGRKEYYSSVSPKGQITLPAEIRRQLGLKPKDQVTIAVQEGQITVEPTSSRLLRHYQRAGSLRKPLNWHQIEEIAHEDHVAHVIREEMGAGGA